MVTVSEDRNLPHQVRVSVGSAVVLGLLEGKLDAEPTTAYLLTYTSDKCTANCGFCPQAKSSQSKVEQLSRVIWPIFSTGSVIRQIINAVHSAKIRRVCIQALNYPTVFDDLSALVKEIKKVCKVPISVSCQPANRLNIDRLAESGLDQIAIAVDAATEKLFDKVKGPATNGPYIWRDQFNQLAAAIEIMGKGNVSTHLIIGLGETEKEAVSFIQKCVSHSVLPALFAFTPIKGTALSETAPPKIETYRRIQLARHLIVNGITTFDSMRFDVDGQIEDFGVTTETILQVTETGKPFQTSGCKHCNRPFYNEKPSGPIYNYPWKPHPKDVSTIKKQLKFN